MLFLISGQQSAAWLRHRPCPDGFLKDLPPEGLFAMARRCCHRARSRTMKLIFSSYAAIENVRPQKMSWQLWYDLGPHQCDLQLLHVSAPHDEAHPVLAWVPPPA